ncbi:MAG: helix-turn-helix transcriptional regulator [Sphingopyxis sp.]|uniref:AraC family transcriptional regulator n=1 Tax=Sphingopyxis sp. TaxID=1908224 RepID=UPI002ABA37A6|nr:helix-turn-helix transcriptional regulator [Sphingopyxis sp.]MDZ3830794.1 helix-turn-helix transcriptional regulator [Sphingopyxis sp.]
MGIDICRTVYPPGYRSGWHGCARAQLIYPAHGVLTIHLERGTWIVPPHRGCWLPADMRHDVETPFGLEMYSAYCGGAVLDRVPQEAGIVVVSDLLRAALLALAAPGTRSDRHIANIERVIVDEIAVRTPAPLHLPTLRSTRLIAIQAALYDNPSDGRTLGDWASELGVSPRTLAREFRSDAHTTFSQYRAQVRLHKAVECLAAGQAVTTIAYDLGFSSPSNFIAMFRKATGATPGAYYAADGAVAG